MTKTALLFIVALVAVLTTARAEVLFKDDFESYRVGKAIEGQRGWTGSDSYTIVSVADGQALHSGRDVPDAAISHAFEGGHKTVYIGLDVDFSVSSANFFWVAATNGFDDDNAIGAVFGAIDYQPAVALRVRESAEQTKTSSKSLYRNPARMVMEVTKSGHDFICKTWFDPQSDRDAPSEYIYGKIQANELNLFYGRRSSVGHSAMIMDNLVVATTFDEAAKPTR
ncbi:hypothetical protein [Cerasicoccus frondis]|uniref:hypothetical protein n=1 Tax=Cerasicoccus frondis TaxID=490090 RepID=UPI00285261FE|nr:hypothetical protein [Cerasicoccus frondis]